MPSPYNYHVVTMSSIKELVENELVLIALFIACARLSVCAGDTALFNAFAAPFKWIGITFLVAAVVYPIRDLWLTLTSPLDS